MESPEQLSNDDSSKKDENRSLFSFIPSEVARWLERYQYSKFHTRNGHGFAAEDANIVNDRLRGKSVEVTGLNNEKNGSDRISAGIPIQTKYCQTASDTVQAAFDQSGNFRYGGQLLEVPKDQYDECVRIMEKRISEGRVPGINDPNDASKIVKRGDVTYRQAKNIARAGNVDSLVFDAKTQAITATAVFSISLAVQFAARMWNGEDAKEAIKGAAKGALFSGASAFSIGLIAAQVLRTRVAAVGNVAVRNGVKLFGRFSFGKNAISNLACFTSGRSIHGAAAISHVGKVVRTNIITGTIASAISATPDVYKLAVARNISWSQFAKNISVKTSAVAGGSGGWIAGAATGATVGSIVPGIGTGVGGFVGGLVGSIAGAVIAERAAKQVADMIAADDSLLFLENVKKTVEELSYEFLFTDEEISQLGEYLPELLENNELVAAHVKCPNEEDRIVLIRETLDPICLEIVQARPNISEIEPATLENAVVEILTN